MAILLGLSVAVAYGAADFLGGLSAKRSPLAAVVVVSQLCGLPIVAALILSGTTEAPPGRALVLGGLGGLAGATGLSCLYRGLAIGRMSTVAPITAVGAAVVPVLWGVAGGERPRAPAWAGVALALVAVVLISSAPGDERTDRPPERVLGLAVTAGAAFGVIFVLLAEGGRDGSFWVLVAVRTTSVLSLAGAAVLTGRTLRPSGRRALVTIAAAGVLDMTANVLYLVGTRRGLLSIVAVLSSLYPATTVLLARAVLHERMAGHQVAGLALALAGIVLIATA